MWIRNTPSSIVPLIPHSFCTFIVHRPPSSLIRQATIFAIKAQTFFHNEVMNMVIGAMAARMWTRPLLMWIIMSDLTGHYFLPITSFFTPKKSIFCILWWIIKTLLTCYMIFYCTTKVTNTEHLKWTRDSRELFIYISCTIAMETYIFFRSLCSHHFAEHTSI